MKDAVHYFIHIFLVLFSLMFAAEVANIITEVKFEFVSIFLAWVLLVWIFLYLLLSLFNTMSHNFSIVALIGAPFLSIPSLLITFVILVITGSNGINLVNKNYSGLYTSTIDEYDHIKNKTFIYRKDDVRFSDEYWRLNELETDSDEPETEEYIFWQTGYLCGFNPKYVIGGEDLDSKEFKLSFCLFAICEIMYLAFVSMLLLFWIPIVHYLITKKKIPLTFADPKKYEYDKRSMVLIVKLLSLIFGLLCFYNFFL